MPLFVFRKLELGKAKPPSVTFLMTDRSLKRPKEVKEDVLIKDDIFIFPADFIMLKMKEEEDIPII